jgi:hypothetical protein
MKTINIRLTEEEHKRIKLAATDEGKSIKDYLLAQKLNGKSKDPGDPSKENRKEPKKTADLKNKNETSFKELEDWSGIMPRKKGKI